MTRKISAMTLAATGCLLLMTQLIGCGPPEMCEDQSEKGFATFHNKTWAPYCGELENRLSDPLSYELLDLTEFFAEFPERSGEMRKTLFEYEKPERCFSTKQGELEYRQLSSCLVDDDDVRARMKKAWKVRAEPWIEDYEKRVKRLNRDLRDLKRDADYIDQKISQKFEVNAPMTNKDLLKLTENLDVIQPKIDTIDRAKDEYERLAAASMANEELNTFIEENYAEQIKQLLKDHEDNRIAIARLRARERYFTYAINTVGRPCVEGPRARKETRVAKKILADAMQSLRAGKTIHISSEIEKTTKEDGSAEVETFSGFFCGVRGPDNQFEEKPTMCSQHKFTLKRERPAGERRWQDWEIEKIEEGSVNEGVDCALLER